MAEPGSLGWEVGLCRHDGQLRSRVRRSGDMAATTGKPGLEPASPPGPPAAPG